MILYALECNVGLTGLEVTGEADPEGSAWEIEAAAGKGTEEAGNE